MNERMEDKDFKSKMSPSQQIVVIKYRLKSIKNTLDNISDRVEMYLHQLEE